MGLCVGLPILAKCNYAPGHGMARQGKHTSARSERMGEKASCRSAKKEHEKDLRNCRQPSGVFAKHDLDGETVS